MGTAPKTGSQIAFEFSVEQPAPRGSHTLVTDGDSALVPFIVIGIAAVFVPQEARQRQREREALRAVLDAKMRERDR